MRSAVAARFLTLRVLTDSIFPPLTRVGHQNAITDENQAVGALPFLSVTYGAPFN